MPYIISRWFSFDAAHRLPYLPKVHPCSRVHGHTYSLCVCVRGEVDKDLGFVLDYRILADVVKPTVDILDHHVLNDIPGLENPTAEQLCLWCWERLQLKLPNLYCVKIKETPKTECEYYGPGAPTR